jgi:SAM-dependent methyltransferase
MHKSSLLRMQWFVQNYLAENKGPIKILDIGSYDVNGSYKQFFDEQRFSYTGLDMSAGPNVDVVPRHTYHWTEIESASFDVVISGQVLEHVEFFWVTAAEMVRVLRSGGLLCIIAPRGFERHRYPVDCYRFDADGMVALARYCNLIPLHASTGMAPKGASLEWHIKGCADSMLVARKPENWNGLLTVDEYVFHDADMEALATGFVAQEKPQKGFRTKLINSIIKRLNKLR